jgi:hypothetical protein
MSADAAPPVAVRGSTASSGSARRASRPLFGVDPEIARGELAVRLGVSGSGRTTPLTLVGCLRRVEAGSVRLFGRELNGAPEAVLVRARRRLGFVFQAHNLRGSLTAVQNVRNGLEVHAPAALVRWREAAAHLLTALALGERPDDAGAPQAARPGPRHRDADGDPRPPHPGAGGPDRRHGGRSLGRRPPSPTPPRPPAAGTRGLSGARSGPSTARSAEIQVSGGCGRARGRHGAGCRPEHRRLRLLPESLPPRGLRRPVGRPPGSRAHPGPDRLRDPGGRPSLDLGQHRRLEPGFGGPTGDHADSPALPCNVQGPSVTIMEPAMNVRGRQPARPRIAVRA